MPCLPLICRNAPLREGAGHWRFLDPSDMHVSEAGNIYVLDSGNKRIVVLDDAWNVIRVIDSFMNEGKRTALQILPASSLTG